MRTAADVSTVRVAEQVAMAQLPTGALMQRAAAGLAAACRDLLGGMYGREVVLAVGSGDNGGDALFAGARLARAGARVRALTVGATAHPEGAAALLRAGGRIEPHSGGVAQVQTAGPAGQPVDLIVDGIVGIGGRGGLRPAAAALVAAWESLPERPFVAAVDLPSGVDADTGRIEGPHVRADLTVTFGALKPGLLVAPGAHAAGTVELVEIGLDPDLVGHPLDDGTAMAVLDLADLPGLLPWPGADSDKYRRGVVGLVTGSPRYPGAGMLSVSGARCGLAGMVRYVAAGSLAHEVALRQPDVVPGTPEHPGRVQAWVVGSGGGDAPPVVGIERLLQDEVPVLVDADGLRHLPPPERRHGARLVLTPHAGELARLLGLPRAQVEADRVATARRAAADLDATVLLKGATTVVAEPNAARPVLVAGRPAPSWLATAGSGDVLSGITGAVLAAFTAREQATGASRTSEGLGVPALAGSLLHAAAARVAGPGLTAARLAAAVPTALAQAAR